MIHLHTDSWLCYGILKQQWLRVHDAVCARGGAGSSTAITMDTLRKPQASFSRAHRTIWDNSRLCGSHTRKVQRLSLHLIWHASQRCLSNPTSENHPSVNLWQVGVCLLFGFTRTATQLMLRRSSVPCSSAPASLSPACVRRLSWSIGLCMSYLSSDPFAPN